MRGCIREVLQTLQSEEYCTHATPTMFDSGQESTRTLKASKKVLPQYHALLPPHPPLGRIYSEMRPRSFETIGADLARSSDLCECA